MLVRKLVTTLLYLNICYSQTILRKNGVLSRKRRYLLFPEGSNFVTTMSFVKAVMVKAPRLVNVLGECDVPFKLPSDPGNFRIKNLHHRQRKEIQSLLKDALTERGLDGNACLASMVCDAARYFPTKGKSLIGDLISTIFAFTVDEPQEGIETVENYCKGLNTNNCELPLFNYILKSFI